MPDTIDPKEYGAIGIGKPARLEEKFGSFESAQKKYPHAKSPLETIDWAAWQLAADVARDRILATMAPGGGIGGTGVSWAPAIVPSPGRYVFNRPVKIFPHTTITGSGWGVTDLVLADGGWAKTAPCMPTNPQGTVWCGKLTEKSALLWLLGDERAPKGVAAGMRNSITKLGLTCHDGACMLIPTNQNHLTIRENHFSGWGNGPTGLGLIMNNASSSAQTTNLFLLDNMFEGLETAFVADKLEPAHISGNQFESCQNNIFVAHGLVHITDNLITNLMGHKPMKNGIAVGVANPAVISGNTIWGVEGCAIKVLGRSTLLGNKILIRNGSRINHSGYAIHVVTPANQFGGDTSVLGGQNRHCPAGNTVDYEGSKPKPQFMDIWFQEAPGEKIEIVKDEQYV